MGADLLLAACRHPVTADNQMDLSERAVAELKRRIDTLSDDELADATEQVAEGWEDWADARTSAQIESDGDLTPDQEAEVVRREQRKCLHWAVDLIAAGSRDLTWMTLGGGTWLFFGGTSWGDSPDGWDEFCALAESGVCNEPLPWNA